MAAINSVKFGERHDVKGPEFSIKRARHLSIGHRRPLGRVFRIIQGRNVFFICGEGMLQSERMPNFVKQNFVLIVREPICSRTWVAIIIRHKNVRSNKIVCVWEKPLPSRVWLMRCANGNDIIF